jgi:hypothetical protein
MATFTIQIKFRCMCFFVPDGSDASKTRMHVLMPDTSGHQHHDHDGRQGSGHGVDPHVARLVYPTRDGGRLEGGKADFVDLKEYALVLPPGGAGASLDLPPELVDLTPITGSVDPALLGEVGHPRVVSRITLEGGGATDHESGATWEFVGHVREMSQQITWTIPDVEGDRLTWSLTRLKPEGEEAREDDVVKLPDAFPAEDGILRLVVHHVMESDFPTPDLKRDPAVSTKHFDAYYDLFHNPSGRPLPKYVDKLESPGISCINGRASR